MPHHFEGLNEAEHPGSRLSMPVVTPILARRVAFRLSGAHTPFSCYRREGYLTRCFLRRCPRGEGLCGCRGYDGTPWQWLATLSCVETAHTVLYVGQRDPTSPLSASVRDFATTSQQYPPMMSPARVPAAWASMYRTCSSGTRACCAYGNTYANRHVPWHQLENYYRDRFMDRLPSMSTTTQRHINVG